MGAYTHAEEQLREGNATLEESSLLVVEVVEKLKMRDEIITNIGEKLRKICSLLTEKKVKKWKETLVTEG